MAVEIVCNIFCTCSATKYNSQHLARFYASLNEVLQGKVDQVLIAALRKSTSLFTYDFPGLNILIPPFLYAIERALSAVKILFFPIIFLKLFLLLRNFPTMS